MLFKSVRVVAFFIFLLISFNSFSQNVHKGTTQWQVDSFYQSSIDSSVLLQSEFIIYGKDRIEWIQRNGLTIDTFNILEVLGDWDDLKEDGRNVYSVASLGIEGRIIFSKTGNITSIEMEFSNDGKNIMPYKFNVISVTRL